MEYIRVVNWEKYQHYSKRRPPWIKLYRDLLRDREFSELPDASRYHLIGLFLLASYHENRIPFDVPYIRRELNAKSRIDFTRLFDSGILAISERRAIVRQRREETDKETEKKQDPPAAVAAFLSLWNALPFTNARKMTAKRLRTWQARMKDADWAASWKDAALRLKHSDFCKGKNDRSWVADVDWFLRPDTVTRILEGKYDNEGAKKKREIECSRCGAVIESDPVRGKDAASGKDIVLCRECAKMGRK